MLQEKEEQKQQILEIKNPIMAENGYSYLSEDDY